MLHNLKTALKYSACMTVIMSMGYGSEDFEARLKANQEKIRLNEEAKAEEQRVENEYENKVLPVEMRLQNYARSSRENLNELLKYFYHQTVRERAGSYDDGYYFRERSIDGTINISKEGISYPHKFKNYRTYYDDLISIIDKILIENAKKGKDITDILGSPSSGSEELFKTTLDTKLKAIEEEKIKIEEEKKAAFKRRPSVVKLHDLNPTKAENLTKEGQATEELLRMISMAERAFKSFDRLTNQMKSDLGESLLEKIHTEMEKFFIADGGWVHSGGCSSFERNGRLAIGTGYSDKGFSNSWMYQKWADEDFGYGKRPSVDIREGRMLDNSPYLKGSPKDDLSYYKMLTDLKNKILDLGLEEGKDLRKYFGNNQDPTAADWTD